MNPGDTITVVFRTSLTSHTESNVGTLLNWTEQGILLGLEGGGMRFFPWHTIAWVDMETPPAPKESGVWMLEHEGYREVPQEGGA